MFPTMSVIFFSHFIVSYDSLSAKACYILVTFIASYNSFSTDVCIIVVTFYCQLQFCFEQYLLYSGDFLLLATILFQPVSVIFWELLIVSYNSASSNIFYILATFYSQMRFCFYQCILYSG